MQGHNIEEKYLALKRSFDFCMSTLIPKLKTDDVRSIAKALRELGKCKIYPPILPASWLGNSSYRRSVVLAKEVSAETIRLADTLQEMWVFYNNLKLTIPIKYYDPHLGVIIDEGFLKCPSHSLVNALFIENLHPLWDFQIRDICIPVKERI